MSLGGVFHKDKYYPPGEWKGNCGFRFAKSMHGVGCNPDNPLHSIPIAMRYADDPLHTTYKPYIFNTIKRSNPMSDHYTPNVPRESAFKRFLRWFRPNHTHTEFVRLERMFIHQASQMIQLADSLNLANAKIEDLRKDIAKRLAEYVAELWTAVKVLEHTVTQKEHSLELTYILSKEKRTKLRKTHELIESFGESYNQKELWIKRQGKK